MLYATHEVTAVVAAVCKSLKQKRSYPYIVPVGLLGPSKLCSTQNCFGLVLGMRLYATVLFSPLSDQL